MKDKAKQSYYVQRWSAKRRNIPFLITFDEWYNWWLSNGIDKRLPAPPYTSNTLCMCRFNDTGPYSLTNIYCATSLQNIHHRTFEHLFVSIQTPKGKFNSLKETAEYYKVNVSTIHGWLKSKSMDFYRL